MEFCGSATNFDVGDVADYYAKPVRLFADPFRGGRNKLVFCETFSREGLPTFANNRFRLRTDQRLPQQSFTFYQSYALFRKDGKPLAPLYEKHPKWDFGRPIADSHYKACLYAGINIASLEPLDGRGEHGDTLKALSHSSLSNNHFEKFFEQLPLVSLVEEKEWWEAPDHLQRVFPQSWGGMEANRTVTSLMLSKLRQMTGVHLALCCNEFRNSVI
ncbi:glutamine synthetase [Trichonephila clavipes]|nr:glutamine synthetase [Trichonephila clavipes]